MHNHGTKFQMLIHPHHCGREAFQSMLVFVQPQNDFDNVFLHVCHLEFTLLFKYSLNFGCGRGVGVLSVPLNTSFCFRGKVCYLSLCMRKPTI